MAACQSTGGRDASARSQTARESAIAQLAEIKPLEASGNPYAGQYKEWDDWTAQHATAVIAAGQEASTLVDYDAKHGEVMSCSVVDKDGYLLPMTEYYRQFEEALKQGALKEFLASKRTVCATGKMDVGLAERTHEAMDDVRCAYYPRIPKWLADNPPVRSMLLPNGDVVTRGPLGSGAGHPPTATPTVAVDAVAATPKKAAGCGGCGGSRASLGWYRFSAAGQPWGMTPAGEWWYLYYDPELRPLPKGKMESRADGYFLFSDPASGKLTRVYDYDGTQLPTSLPPQRDLHLFSMLTPHRLKMYYAAQQRSQLDTPPIH